MLAVEVDAVRQENDRLPPFEAAEHAERFRRRIQVSGAATGLGIVNELPEPLTVRRELLGLTGGRFANPQFMVEEDQPAIRTLMQPIEETVGGLLGLLHFSVFRHAAADVDGENGR